MSESFDRPEIPAAGIMAGLDAEDRQLLGDYGEFLPVHPDQLLITEGKGQDSLYFVISGVLHVHTDTKEKRTLVARIGAGETIGEVNLFDPDTASASVTAREFAQVWKANKADLEAFMSSYPTAAAKLLSGILAGMSARLRRMNEKLATREAEAAFQSFWS
ncbi:Crp/Fnr family transcriptional regulator [Haloferula sargassicola]|uniref:Cyclic nucleotide-binding domain-containing protein n=1 Tax=Haloferula sargassicola TaxID=490096 RepID=A0ABP9UWR6_9BACT